MNVRQCLKKLVFGAPPWLLSAMLHAGILAAAGMVTWVVLQPKILDRILNLAPPPAGVDESGRDDAGGGGGSPGSGGGPAGRPAAPAETAAPPGTPVVAAAAPIPQKLMEALTPPTISPLSDQALAGVRDPGSSLTIGLIGGMKGPTATGATGAVGTGTSGGTGGLLDGTSAGFGKYVGSLRGTGMDLVLVLDATDSMTPYIEQAKARLREVLNVVTGLVPNARVGVVAYKDYGDDYGPTACRLMALTDNHQAVRRFIDETIAGGGGDIPEPIHEALAIATSTRQMGWNPRRKRVIILVGDSPCHSTGRAAAYNLAAAFAKEGGVINIIDTGGTGAPGVARVSLQPDLQRIARDGGGSAFLLTDGPAFWRHLIVSVFGERYERDVNTIIEKFAKKE
jgi:hypothetical protein